jgi:hypothetical protein
VAKAGPEDAALLQQVKQAASKGQSPQTAAQISQYVDSNQDVITAILKGYMDYLKQIQSMSADTGTGAGIQAAPQASSTVQQQQGVLQPSTALQITGVQTSGSLQTSHLAGYPSLPNVDPVSSLTQPTAAQLAHGAQVQKEMQERKAYLMEHPEGYTY